MRTPWARFVKTETLTPAWYSGPRSRSESRANNKPEIAILEESHDPRVIGDWLGEMNAQTVHSSYSEGVGTPGLASGISNGVDVAMGR